MLALVLLLASRALAADSDLILSGGRVFLGPGQFAESIAIAGNRVAAVGPDAEVMALKGPKTTVIALAGRAVVPGFHDAHVQLFKGGLSLTEVDLRGSKSIEEVRDRLADYAARHAGDDWIFGRGWDAASWRDGRLPVREDIDAAVSTRPVALTDADGRRLWLNSLGLQRAGITTRTPKLNLGEIVKDARGVPTGVFIGDAMALVTRALPQRARQEKLAALRLALAAARENGVTSLDSMSGAGDPPLAEQVDLWRELHKAGELTARLFLYGRLEDAAAAAKLAAKTHDVPRNRLSIVGVAGEIDGSLGDRSAALLKPYFDDPHVKGEPRYASFRLDSLVKSAHKAALQAALQAVGDRAARMALDACEASERRAKEEERVLPEFPCRVERVEVLAPADLARFKALSAAASLQPGRLVCAELAANENPNRLGDRVRYSFAWKSLEDAGALVAFGSGWPAAALDPRAGLFEATSRQCLDGKPGEGWIPEQRISLESAVSHYALDPARLVGFDDELGALKPGKLADLAVFSDDLFARSGRALLSAEVDLTVFDGKIVFQRPPKKD